MKAQRGEQMYNSTLPSTSALDGIGGQRHAPTALLPGKTRYPLYRRLGGPQGRSGRAQKISPPTGIRSPDRPARSESLYRLSYPGPQIIYLASQKGPCSMQSVSISGIKLQFLHGTHYDNATLREGRSWNSPVSEKVARSTAPSRWRHRVLTWAAPVGKQTSRYQQTVTCPNFLRNTYKHSSQVSKILALIKITIPDSK